MQKVTSLLLLLILFSIGTSFAQKKTEAKNAKGMAKFTKDKNFKNAHPEPMAAKMPGEGKLIDLKGANGAKYKAFEVKPANTDEKTTTIFMIHEWWGLNNNIMQEAVKLSKELNVRVVALDLYGKMKAATTKEEAGKLMENADEKYCKAVITAAFNTYPNAAKTATIGWCFGGGWSLQAALIGGKRTNACVMYYGMPEDNVKRLNDELYCDVLFVHALKDQWINKDVVGKFTAQMNQASKKLVVLEYDADHAFANPSNPQFDKASTADANKKTIDFLMQHLN